jgi:hypothetical protein
MASRTLWPLEADPTWKLAGTLVMVGVLTKNQHMHQRKLNCDTLIRLVTEAENPWLSG